MSKIPSYSPLIQLPLTYIVYLGGHSHGPNPSLDDLESATNSHYDFLASVFGSREKAEEAVLYSYNKHINGFAALLEEEEASEIARVWPEHISFSDFGYGPVPSKWRGNGVCEIDHFTSLNTAHCNRKLIGARIFSKDYESRYGKLNPLNLTARDFVGHGTHTLSTAAGNFIPGATIFGNGNGTAKGGSPRARVATYKVCWSAYDAGGCHEADILQAFDQAIYDGVDVISTSVGASDPYIEAFFTDGISIGAFHAVARNIVVVCSAGNDGPAPRTVTNVAPWSFTVAASTIDRDFWSDISLANKHYFKGASLSRGLPSRKFYPLVHSIDARFPNATIEDARFCKHGTLDPTKVRGKLLVCIRQDRTTSVAQGYEAALAGAVGIFVINDEKSGNILLAEPHPLPGASLDVYEDDDIDEREWFGKGGSDKNNSREMAAYMNAATTYTGIKPAPIMAGFSSRGPSAVQPLILKPDVTAPGVNILAAYSLATSPSNLPSDRRRVPFNMQQGTSMSCPHVAGIVGLLKTLHPSWSPAAIKSAIMTTATTLDNTNQPIRDAFDQIATPFEYGSGHIRPNLAMDPGLVYNLSTIDYLNFICASGHDQNILKFFNHSSFTCPESYNIENFNYASITVTNRGMNPINVTRTVTNVGPPSTYIVETHSPKEFKVLVQPSSLTFMTIREKKTFQVILQAISWPPHGFPIFGNLTWTNGKHRVTSPIVVL
ncbi:Peptidase S8/S53 domain [Sesbania bispinosa]|nr:Peptidase S8/S53 domain [Sesbania bispinosa]